MERQSVHYCYYLNESTARDASAHWACPAGLSGCNHVTAILYCLEEYIYLDLHDNEVKGCTDRLQTWNQPRKRHTEPRPTDEVELTKKRIRNKKES